MLNNIRILIIFLFIVLPFGAGAVELSERLSGYILLQVEQNGEAWYVDPKESARYFLGRPLDAFQIMREKGVGITNADLDKIPIGLKNLNGEDFDEDGLNNAFEDAIGTDRNKKDTDGDGFDDLHEVQNGFDPRGSGNMPINVAFSQKNKGKIFLQVQNKGEAWYLDPRENKRYFLGRPSDAFRIMREQGMGITNEDLNKILARTPSFFLSDLESDIHKLINEQRKNNGLKELTWNNDLASVARGHSFDLAEENKYLTGFGISCDYPIIHHEGFNSGIYNTERLETKNIYYFSKTGENIALMSGVSHRISFWEGDDIEQKIKDCYETRTGWDQDMKIALDAEEDNDKKLEILREEIDKRKTEVQKSEFVNIVDSNWVSREGLVQKTVEGWMNSEGHRKNILTVDFDEAGIGVAYINGYFISTQVFIKRAECGFKNGDCCEKDGYYPYCYVPLECSFENICE